MASAFASAAASLALAETTILATRQRLRALSGRVSSMRTTSPMPHSFFSSCVGYFFPTVTCLP